MPTTCPRCASMLDDVGSFCGRCDWSAPYLVRRRQASTSQMSYTERYRGTEFDPRYRTAVVQAERLTRARAFVIMSFASLSALVAAFVLSRPPV